MRLAVPKSMDDQLDALKREVTNVKPIIRDNILAKIISIEDAMVLKYNQLQDMSKIKDNINQVFKGYPILHVLADAASNMIATMNTTDELTDILRWQQRKHIKRVRDKVYGLELHSTAKIFEKTKRWVESEKELEKSTFVLFAFKANVCTMELNPADYPDEEDLSFLRFWST